ncbi:MAG: Wzz/FepE/Etk N-terminal domain-containing protein [Oenococcus sp.]|uniref:Capsular polysaccharide biosynthesis protein CpsC n=1 Tax=Oenococcus kitaharae DSM 17330 TaxID=1045004 RepID=G9WJC2_9LACO|nr:Wzz/FepE/Etk N-terminal domain-containing protein [Oenococcus kitaharae]EHN58728.1 capsular polysaccharide biosynthesis protein [Oenococcus kitaharae DSM 17330]MCV3297177.1 Wzz/FepE/Etk N-terminal domain-containing protein [Oenococcus kitaharae]OEY83190.1 capsular biosynthesis protein [Oenococcus kitaharae]OEY84288.1 capsular biosynthesis protein [Oenococcus kitaharae]OEY85870.1 capsular biosynthesis protein [Oenococcus kitaharae]
MKTYSLLDLLKLLIKKWWIWLLAAIIFAGFGFAYSRMAAFRTYHANAVLTISHNYSNFGDNDKKNSDANALDLTQSDILLQNSIQALIKNSAITDDAKKTVAFSSGDVTVTSPDNSVLMHISASAANKRKAVRIVNALAASTKKVLPRILPAAGKVIVAQKATNTVRETGPSTRKFTLIGAALGLVLSGAVLLWNDIKDKLK